MNTEMTREIILPTGTLTYRSLGTGDPIVFVHGLLANSGLWHAVMPLLAPDYHCIAPDLPLGGHHIALPPDADRSPRGIAQMLGNFCDALGLRDITLVGNDTGGALCQLLISQRPELVARLVLTNCDAYDQFFPLSFRFLTTLSARFGDGFTSVLASLLRQRTGQRLLMASVSRRHYDAQALDAYFTPFLQDAAVRHDTARFMAAVSSRDTVAAAQTFRHFAAPVLLAWGRNDFLFSPRLAKRLHAAFPHATLKWVQGSRAFVPEDQPQVLAQLLQEFLHVPTVGGIHAA
jgi:pimeloyl-ACP methyl ester carboxylesterase